MHVRPSVDSKMIAHASKLMVLLTCAVTVHALAPGPSREERTRSAVFAKVATDHKLTGHVIATHDVTSSLECADACLSTSGCKSYNYQEAGSPLHVCQLSNQSKSSAPSSDYVIQAGFSYYDAEQYVMPGCSSSSCKNGGTCQIAGCTSDYVCQCTDNYFGENCETYTGLGSSSAQPGHSCLYIKKHGKAKGDGDYWIDPTRSGNPFLVKCDMTTDGGGWTLIKALTLSSSSHPINRNLYEGAADYTKLGTLQDGDFVLSPGLEAFKTASGFQQIRYLCRKVSVGKTIHIKTAMNASGYDAVRYIVSGGSHPTACGSYVRLSDDDSILTANCDKWGLGSGDIGQINKWGHYVYKGTHRPFHRMMFWKDGSRSFGFISTTFWCDDKQINNLQPGDFWKVFVR